MKLSNCYLEGDGERGRFNMLLKLMSSIFKSNIMISSCSFIASSEFIMFLHVRVLQQLGDKLTGQRYYLTEYLFRQC